MTSLDAARINTAAAQLLQRRLTGTQGDRLPESIRPTTVAEAVAIQTAITERWCEQQDDSIGGWKCGLPSADKVIAAPIFTRTINSVAPVVIWPTGDVMRIEPELAFILAVDLPPREDDYTPAEIDAAIARTHLALELIHSRYLDPKSCSFPEMLADNLVNQGLLIGPAVDGDIAKRAETIDFSLTINGQTRTIAGTCPSGLPRAPLYWLVNHLSTTGQGLVAGQAIITGSYAGVIEVPLNTNITLEYQGLGALEAHFTPL